MARRTVLAGLVILLGGCAQATPISAPPTVTAMATQPSPRASRPTASTSPGPSPPATRASAIPFPTRSEVELLPGRYSSSPPFDIPFSFEIPDAGWQSAHLHGEFFDVLRLDGPDPREPTRWVAWAHPATLYGTVPVAAAELTAEQAAATVAANDGLVAGHTSSFVFGGLRGVQLDVHANSANVPVFGGAAGDFGLQPSHDARLGFVNVGTELLVVMCLAGPDELDEACAEVQPILASVLL